MQITVEEAFNEFIAESELTTEEITVKDYKRFCRYFFRIEDVTMTGDIVTEMTEKTFNAYMLKLKTRASAGEISTATVNTYLRAVRRFISFCREKFGLPFYKTHLIKETVLPKETLTDEELMTVLRNVREDNQASLIAGMLAVTAGRSRSVRLLRVRDVDFAGEAVLFTKTKNKKVLALPLAKEFCDTLARFCSLQGRKANDLLFQNKVGKNFDEYSLYKVVNKHLRSLGIEKTGVHIFRHSVAKQFVLRGMDAVTLQNWMGHSSIAQSSHYVTFYGSDLKRNFDNFDLFSQFHKK